MQTMSIEEEEKKIVLIQLIRAPCVVLQLAHTSLHTELHTCPVST